MIGYTKTQLEVFVGQEVLADRTVMDGIDYSISYRAYQRILVKKFSYTFGRGPTNGEMPLYFTLEGIDVAANKPVSLFIYNVHTNLFQTTTQKHKTILSKILEL